MKRISTRDLKIYIETDGIKHVDIIADGANWLVKMHTRLGDERWLTTDKSKTPRSFPNIDKSVKHLLKVGYHCHRITIYAENYDPDAPTGRERPDVSQRQSVAHQLVKKNTDEELLCRRCGELLTEDEVHPHNCEDVTAPDKPPLSTHDHDPALG